MNALFLIRVLPWIGAVASALLAGHQHGIGQVIGAVPDSGLAPPMEGNGPAIFGGLSGVLSLVGLFLQSDKGKTLIGGLSANLLQQLPALAQRITDPRLDASLRTEIGDWLKSGLQLGAKVALAELTAKMQQ